MCVPSRNARFPLNWKLLVKEHIANVCTPLDVLGFIGSKICCVWKFIWVFESLQTSLLCILGELAGEGLWMMALVTGDK